ncbi:MAG TPA: hypothetical protein VGF28_08135 [Thermoanaerobaculia bacterium]|jgi:hypothetical protein
MKKRPAFGRLVLFFILHSAFCVLRSSANDLLVDTRTLQSNDLLTITVSLEGSFATVDDVDVPLRNLRRVGDPWVSSEFAWINGEVVRRKVFRFRARPIEPGPALVGPLRLNAEDGQRDTLPAIDVQVMPDRASGSNDPTTVLRELLSVGREPLFVVAEIDKRRVYAGEPVLVTWWLYNGATVQQWHIVSVPKLAEFWSEERQRSEQPERVYVGDSLMQRLPVRRVMLFPLRSGTLRIGGLTVEAAIMRRVRSGPFSMYEGELVETTFTSAPIDLAVQPLPPGPPVDAVGDLQLSCAPPLQRNNGPVVVNVTLLGAGNVRSATPPKLDGEVAGRVQVEGGEVTVSRDEAEFAMARKWRYLIFPAASAPLAIPPLAMRIFDPGTGQRRELRCSESFVNAIMARAPEQWSGGLQPAESPLSRRAKARRSTGFVVAAALLLGVVLFAVPRVRRELALRREVRELVSGATPAEIRARVEERVKIDLRERSDRGDAYRALRSLLDAAERDRDIAVDAEEELERRLRELFRIRR